jgi:hypothetical protein
LSPKPALPLVQWCIAIVYLMKAIFGAAWAVAEDAFMGYLR